jgi:hypothetical protein
MSLSPVSTGLLLGLPFDPENGGNVLLRNPELFSELHPVTNQNIVLFIVTAAKTSNPTLIFISFKTYNTRE